uniref:SHSP domain-containing protein n=1 Tax=Steinernema glaseri TaxID=37863 RepID=A0A1I7ZNN8_9BILA
MEPQLDNKRNKFGSKHKIVRRMSSTDWEVPSGEASQFAKVKNTEDGFSARIDLESFGPTYNPEDVDIDVYGYDLQINARKEDPVDPNRALRELHRQYRMPDNVDLETVRMKRNRKNTVVRVEAKLVDGYGKPVALNVYEANKNPKYTTIN